MSFVSLENQNLMISTIKKSDDDNQVVLRCYDAEGRDSEARISLFKPFKSAAVTNMIEEEGKSIPGEGNDLVFNVGHHAIETIKLNF